MLILESKLKNTVSSLLFAHFSMRFKGKGGGHFSIFTEAGHRVEFQSG